MTLRDMIYRQLTPDSFLTAADLEFSLHEPRNKINDRLLVLLRSGLVERTNIYSQKRRGPRIVYAYRRKVAQLEKRQAI